MEKTTEPFTPFPGPLQRTGGGCHMRYHLTETQKAWFAAYYPERANKWLASQMGITETAVFRLGRAHNLYKDVLYISQMRRESTASATRVRRSRNQGMTASQHYVRTEARKRGYTVGNADSPERLVLLFGEQTRRLDRFELKARKNGFTIKGDDAVCPLMSSRKKLTDEERQERMEERKRKQKLMRQLKAELSGKKKREIEPDRQTAYQEMRRAYAYSPYGAVTGERANHDYYKFNDK